MFPANSRYYHNITSNTLGLLEAMVKYDVKTLIYSSTCATYGEPETMPITETTPQVTFLYTSCINLYYWDVSLCLNLALKWLLCSFCVDDLCLWGAIGTNKSIWQGKEDGRGHHFRLF